MKDKIIVVLRWICILPASIAGSYLLFVVVSWMYRTKEYPYTNIDSLWDGAVLMLANILFGGAFVGIGVSIAPSHKRICSCVLFALICMLVGFALSANVISKFSWTSIVNNLCTIGGAGYAFYLCFNNEQIHTNN